MSSILLRKPHGDKKAGDVISVPFGVGKTMIADGTGVYPDSAKEDAPKDQRGGEQKPPGEPPIIRPEFPPQPTPQPSGHEKHKQK